MGYGVSFLPGRWKRQPQGPVAVDVARFGAPFSLFYPNSTFSVDVAGRSPWTGLESVSAAGATMPVSTQLVGSGASSRVGLDEGVIVVVATDSASSSSGSFRQLFDSDTKRHALYHSNQANVFEWYVDGALTFATEVYYDAQQEFVLVARYSKAKSQGRVFFKGKAAASSNSFFIGSSGLGSNIYIGSRFTNTDKWTGSIKLAATLQDVGDNLSAALSENPWQLFRAPRPIIYSFPSATIPTLSSATVVNVSTTGATPQVYVDFP